MIVGFFNKFWISIKTYDSFPISLKFLISISEQHIKKSCGRDLGVNVYDDGADMEVRLSDRRCVDFIKTGCKDDWILIVIRETHSPGGFPTVLKFYINCVYL